MAYVEALALEDGVSFAVAAFDYDPHYAHPGLMVGAEISLSPQQRMSLMAIDDLFMRLDSESTTGQQRYLVDGDFPVFAANVNGAYVLPGGRSIRANIRLGYCLLPGGRAGNNAPSHSAEEHARDVIDTVIALAKFALRAQPELFEPPLPYFHMQPLGPARSGPHRLCPTPRYR